MAYEAYEKRNELEEEDYFAVIRDFSLLMNVAVLHAPKKLPTIPNTRVTYKIDLLQFRLTPKLYGYFLDITNVFTPSEADEGLQELTRNKSDVVSSQRMLGIVKKRGTGIKKYWYTYYCCLIGGYLYFYETNKQPYPSSYFYLKNTEVTYGDHEIGVKNTLILRNKFEQCYLAFNSAKHCLAWKDKIDEVVKEISILSEKMYKKVERSVDVFDVSEEANIIIKKLLVEFYNEDAEQLVRGELSRMECAYVKRSEDLKMEAKVFSFELFHPDNKHYKKILYNEECEDLLNLSIDVVSQKSPRFKGALLIFEAQVGHIMAYYPPKLVKELMRFIEKRKKTSAEEEKKGEILESLIPLDECEESLEKINTCMENKDVLMKVHFRFENFKLHCLHHQHDTLFVLFAMETSTFKYSKGIDHENMVFNFGNSVLSDLTNYPNTMLPSEYSPSDIRAQSLLEIQASYLDSACLVEMVSYSPHCPQRPLTPENLSNKLQIKIGTIRANFYKEHLVDRFADYFVFNLLDSLSPRDAVAESMLIYSRKNKPHEHLDLYDIVFLGSFSAVDFTVQKPLVYLRPRLSYQSYFVIDLGNVHIWNERQKVAGRWLKHSEAKFLCDIYYMDTNALTMNYNEQYSIVEPCHFFIQFELPCVEAYDYSKHSPLVLDLSKHIKINIPKTLRIRMRPEHYTYLLKCIDLNINYTDMYSEVFNFRKVKANVIKGGVDYRLECSFVLVSFLVMNSDASLLAEFVARELCVSFTGNNDKSKRIFVGASHVYSLNAPNSNERTKSIIIAPLFSSNEVPADNVFYAMDEDCSSVLNGSASVVDDETKNVQVRIEFMDNGDRVLNVNIGKHKMFVQLYFLMLLSHFFINGFPNYKNSLEQPNECTSFYSTYIDIEDPEKKPKAVYKLVLSDTLFLLPSEDVNNTLVLKGELTIDYLSECISRVKGELSSSSLQLNQSSNFSETREISSLAVSLDEMYPFMCDARDLDGRPLKSVGKRKILEPLTMRFSTKDFMQFDKLDKSFKVFGDVVFEGKEVFITISYQDIVNLANAFIYNMKMLEKEYFARMIRLSKVKAKSVTRTVIEEEYNEVVADADSSFRSLMDDPNSAYMTSSMEDTIITVLGKAMKAMDQLKKASDEVAQYKDRATQYARKSALPDRKMTDVRLNPDPRYSGFLEVPRQSNAPRDESLTIRSFYKDSVQNASGRSFAERDSEIMYERLHDSMQLYFESIKIVHQFHDL